MEIMSKWARAAMAAAACGTAMAAPPAASNVALSQPKGTRHAVVAFDTDKEAIASFQFKTNGVEVCHAETVRAVTGAINRRLPAGSHTFTWDAGQDIPGQNMENFSVEITLWPANCPPLYCAVNLAASEPETRWYAKASEVPSGVTNSLWKTDWLLMRKIPATGGDFVTLGSSAGEPGRVAGAIEDARGVRISKPFYTGVYAVTQRQWEIVMNGAKPSHFNNPGVYGERPVESVSYTNVRGSGLANSDFDWPGKGHAVSSASFMGRLRAKAGNTLQFDLPTEAQFEYACRAGVYGAFWNNGNPVTNATQDASLNLLGRNQYNGGMVPGSTGYTNPPQDCTDENGTAKVGSYLPNAWGLYDMHGNVLEFTLDWYVADGADSSLAGVDPQGPQTATVRTCRGGRWNAAAGSARSAFRGSAGAGGQTYNYVGLRVTAPAGEAGTEGSTASSGKIFLRTVEPKPKGTVLIIR